MKKIKSTKPIILFSIGLEILLFINVILGFADLPGGDLPKDVNNFNLFLNIVTLLLNTPIAIIIFRMQAEKNRQAAINKDTRDDLNKIEAQMKEEVKRIWDAMYTRELYTRDEKVLELRFADVYRQIESAKNQ